VYCITAGSAVSKELANIYVQEFKENYIKDVEDLESRIKMIDGQINSDYEKYKNQLGSQTDANKKMTDFTPIGKDRERSRVLKKTAQEANEKTSKIFKSYETKVNVLQKLNEDLSKLRSEVTSDYIKIKYASEIKTFSKEGGLLDRYKALRKNIEKRNLEGLSYLLTAIMAMVEISPLLLKTMYPKGNYEKMIEERSEKGKNRYIKELEFEEKRLIKIMEIADGRLNLDSEKFADSKLHPSNLRASNNLINRSEENLKSDLDDNQSKEFIIYTSEEKKENQNQSSHPKTGNILNNIQEKINELLDKIKKMDEKKKLTFLAVFTATGLFAQNFKALSDMYKDIISLFIR
jgi:Domain of unknown function (DUF4407)